MGSITVSKTEVSLCNVAAYNVVSFLRSEIVDLKGKKKKEKKPFTGFGLALFSQPDGWVYNGHNVGVLIIFAGQNSLCNFVTLKGAISMNVSTKLNKTYCSTCKAKNKR